VLRTWGRERCRADGNGGGEVPQPGYPELDLDDPFHGVIAPSAHVHRGARLTLRSALKAPICRARPQVRNTSCGLFDARSTICQQVDSRERHVLFCWRPHARAPRSGGPAARDGRSSGVLVLTPVGVFMFLTIKAVGQELARLSGVRKSLEARLAETRLADEADRLRLELEQIRERRKTAGRQRLLPIKQPAFLFLLAASVLMLVVLPLFIPWFGDTSQATAGSGPSISDAVCAACGNAPFRAR
jgi:hypothetical protein